MRYFLLTLIIFFSTVQAHAAGEFGTSGWNLYAGLRGGFSHVAGHYSDEFGGSEYIGLYLVPYQFRFIMVQIDFDYSRYPLANNRGRKLYAPAFGIGPVFYYPVINRLQLFAGLSFRGTYLYMKSDLLQREEKAFKPGIGLTMGCIVPVVAGLKVRLGADYSYLPLSAEPFHRLTYSIGLSFDFNGYRRWQKENIHQSKIKEAAKIKEARTRIERGRGRDEYKIAQKLIEQGKLFESISHLEKASSSIPAAVDDLKDVRVRLSPLARSLEKKGIAAYKNQRYAQCISLMRQLRTIQPENLSVKLYLPRAVRRYNAEKKIR